MRILVLALVWAGTCLGQFPGDAVILETSEEGETLLLSGKERDLDVPREPASTFKTVIAWAALDRGLVKEVEAPLPGAEGENLRMALQKSLNPPFDLLAVELGGEVLGGYAERSGLIQGKVPARWMEGREKEAERLAVTESVSPRWKELVAELQKEIEVEVVPAVELAEVPKEYEAKRFTPFWKKFGKEWGG